MKRADRIKLDFTRNWKLPGKKRLANWLKPSSQLKTDLGSSIVWLDNEDIAIYTDADNYIEWTIISEGTYESEIGKLIRITLKPGDVALDIGANMGLQSIRMALAIGPAGKVYAFEPLKYLQYKFDKNIKLNRLNNVKLFPVALSDQNTETDLSYTKSYWNQGSFNINAANTGPDTQKVTIKIADDMPEIQELTKLDLIKIDVEGFENHVLKGLYNTLKRLRPGIIFEYDVNYWTQNGQSIAECYNSLRSLDYIIYQITPIGCQLINSPAAIEGGNLFCLNNGN